MQKQTMIDGLIEDIKTDRLLLEEAEAQVASAKEAKRRIAERLKEYRSDIFVLSKYLDEQQKSKLKALNLHPDPSSQRSRMNSVAEGALTLLTEAKDFKLNNAQWHADFIKAHADDYADLSYSEFNIKCRSLFNTMKVLRTKGKDPSSSKDDVISLNGRPMKAVEDSKGDKEDKSLEKAKPKKADGK